MVITLNKNIDKKVIEAIAKVNDPEIPVLTVLDLGVIKKITQIDKTIHIDLTPTYTGCPAMDTIAMDLRTELAIIGYKCNIKMVLSPAWSTDDLSESGKEKLKAYGIAQPLDTEKDKQALMGEKNLVSCPKCKSNNTKVISPFGSTACKALFKCLDCLEPFDYFKCLK